MKFRSTTGEDIHIALTSGHTAIIGPVATELDKLFHREAIARGCLPEGVAEEEAQQPSGFNREQVITDGINAMLDGEDESDFNGDGKPNLSKLNARVGFHVARDEADRIWNALDKKA